MALSVLVVVGDAQSWVPELIQRAKALKIGNGFEPDMDLGPVISRAAKDRIEGLIASCEKEGGKILLDGRGAKVDGYPNGNWVGPTVLECTPDMTCYKQEIFGPGQSPPLVLDLTSAALCVVKADSFDHAIKIMNDNAWGNGASIFTQSGATARAFGSSEAPRLG